MIKKLNHLLFEKYDLWAMLAVVAYMLCSMVTVTVLDYIRPVSLLVKLVRYGLYAFMVLLVLVRFYNLHPAKTISQALHNLAVYLTNHLLVVVLLITGVLTFLISGSLIPFAIVLLLITAKPLNLDKLLKAVFFSQLVCMLAVMAMAALGIIPDLMYSAASGGYRHSLGYIYPLEMHSHVFFLFLLGAYLYQKKYGFIAFILISIINYGVFKLSVARTNLLMIDAGAFLLLLAVKIKKPIWKKLFGWKHWNAISFWTILFIFLLPIGACLAYKANLPIWDKLDQLFTGRLSLCRNALETYPLTLFGNHIEWLGSGGPNGVFVWEEAYNFADCSYIKDLLDYGLVLYSLMILSYYWFVWHFSQKNNAAGIACILCVLGCSMMEPRLLSISLNTFLLLLAVPALADNEQVASWFKKQLPPVVEWKAMPKWGKAVTGVIAVALIGCFMWYMFILHQYGARRVYAKDQEEKRLEYQDTILYTPITEEEDPYLFNRLSAQALKDTSDSYESLVETVPLRKMRSVYIEDDAFKKLKNPNPKEETYEKIFQNYSSHSNEDLEKMLGVEGTLK